MAGETDIEILRRLRSGDEAALYLRVRYSLGKVYRFLEDLCYLSGKEEGEGKKERKPMAKTEKECPVLEVINPFGLSGGQR